MEKIKLYEALYCCCIHESSYATLSIHRTKRGAYNAIRNHKLSEYKEWMELGVKFRKRHKFAQHEDWFIKSIEVED